MRPAVGDAARRLFGRTKTVRLYGRHLSFPLIFHNPFITVLRVQRSTRVTQQGARNLLDRAESYGWVEYMGAIGSSGRHYYGAKEILDIIEAPTLYQEEQRNAS